MSLRHAILGVLHTGPAHGYQVLSELDRLIAGGRYNSAQIYQSLRWLADHELVVAAAPEPGLSRDRRPFDITPKGRREFARWLRTPIALPRPARDEALIKLVFLGLHDPSRLVAFLARLRRQHLRRVAGMAADASEITAQVVDESLIGDLASAVLRFRTEAEVRWIDYCLLRLRPILGTATGDELEPEVVSLPDRRARTPAKDRS